MIFADKIIRLRKRNGWSQEEMADKMGVSRQAVSKWESAQAIPDLAKILQLSQMFGVTTDYLLRDELETEQFAGDGDETSAKRVTLAEANEYLQQRKSASLRIAGATLLCVLAVIPLIILGVISSLPSAPISETAAAVIGLVAMFIIAATGVALFIYTGFKNAPYEFLEKEPFETEYGVNGMVGERMKAYRATYMKLNIAAACVCVLSPVALFIGAFSENTVLLPILLAVTMLMAGLGAAMFIIGGVRWSSMQRLLKEGEYSDREKKHNAVSGTVSSVYWLLAVAVYLGWSFSVNDWSKSWIIWPIAGVLYPVIIAICNLITKNRGDNA